MGRIRPVQRDLGVGAIPQRLETTTSPRRALTRPDEADIPASGVHPIPDLERAPAKFA